MKHVVSSAESLKRMSISFGSRQYSAVTQVKQVNVLKSTQVLLQLLQDSPAIKVCVRVRPFIKEEVEGQRSGGECKLCIDMPSETQELGEIMLEHAMNGFNNCIFAYGQTGSGKSYSVLGGKDEERGLLPRVVEGLFDHFAKLPQDPGVQHLSEVAFMEIYNEQIRDLLAPADSEIKKLEVKQHPVLGTIIPGLTEAAVASCEEVLNLVDYGTQMRHVSATAMNATSSRSRWPSEQDGKNERSKRPERGVHSTMWHCPRTHLVDLAGSERAGRTKATGDRLKEGAAINQSLSTLARVISELAKSAKTKKKPNPPFRESKLTYILKESLCGNSKTVMMAAISPNFTDYDETLSTLKFSQSVKQVQTKALNALKSQLQAIQDPQASDELSFLKRRLEEQEQLCAYYGKDWDSLLAEERSRIGDQGTSLHPSALHPAAQLRTLEKKKIKESLSSDEDMEEDDDVESFTCSLLMLGKPIDEAPPEGRSSFVAPIRSLAGPCPMAQKLLSQGQKMQSELLNRRLEELAAAAAEAMGLLNGAARSEGLLSLKVLVVADPRDDQTFEAGLVVQANELKKRLAWLKQNRPEVSSKSPADAWMISAHATSGNQQMQQLQRQNAELERRLAEMESRLKAGEGGDSKAHSVNKETACSLVLGKHSQ
eukprot:g6908.t1